MHKIANVRRYNTLKIVTSLMYLKVDEKRCTFYDIYLFSISFCNLSNMFIAKINPIKLSVKSSHKNKFSRIHSFWTWQTRIFVTQKFLPSRYENFEARMNSFIVTFKAFYQLCRTTNDHLLRLLNLIIS